MCEERETVTPHFWNRLSRLVLLLFLTLIHQHQWFSWLGDTSRGEWRLLTALPIWELTVPESVESGKRGRFLKPFQ